MSNKKTNNTVVYPENLNPDVILPKKPNKYRYLIGREGSNSLVVIVMNPSVADKKRCDRTIRKIIKIGERLGYDGWVVLNVYPEMSTKPENIGDYKESISRRNINIILNYLKEHEIKEVWIAWGNLNVQALLRGKDLLLEDLKKENIKYFTFAELTNQGNPVHPLNRIVKQHYSKAGKKYVQIEEDLSLSIKYSY